MDFIAPHDPKADAIIAGVVRIYAAECAFAAVKCDGTLVTSFGPQHWRLTDGALGSAEQAALDGTEFHGHLASLQHVTSIPTDPN